MYKEQGYKGIEYISIDIYLFIGSLLLKKYLFV